MVILRDQLSESYPAVAEAVPRARAAVAELAAHAGLGGERLDAVRLAVSEAASNAVRHAYRGEQTGTFHLTVTVAGGELWVLVSDDGCGYRTPADDPGLGWGLALIAEVSEEYVVTERATGGTEIRMHFPLSDGEPVLV